MRNVTHLISCILSVGILSGAASAQDTEVTRGGFIDFLVSIIHALDAFAFKSINIFGIEIQWIIVWMAMPMILLTLYFRFINLRSFRRAWDIVRGKYHDDMAPGEVTQFQALSTALSGTVGLGNIAGVAVAISIGGPGASFWMILIGTLAMTLKFAECTLGVKYRKVHADGTISGGPMYYLEAGLKERGWGTFGKILAWTYAILAVPTLLQVAQVNQSYEAINYVAGFEGNGYKWGFGVITATLTAIVIIGGIRSIAQVTSRLVPLMAGIYITAAMVIILGNVSEVPAAFVTIFNGAFSPESVGGGIIGVIIIGMKRAVYSTEAGLGSATIAHAAAKTREPVSEGMVALMEPFIDTVVVSTMTALVIIITGAYIGSEGTEGVALTSGAFGSVISWFPYILAIASFMFAFSTIISWGYYSGKIWEFVFGGSDRSMNLFKIIFCVTLVPGAVFSLKEVYMLMDSLFFLMAVPNILGIYIMAPVLKRDLQSYLERLKSGEIKPKEQS
ncbi:alanine glycine permease [Kordiimonas sediminis]|uniref:Alanine glycine permease n=1 Tax=Kordiimonas sediminis TaxID=1735581 RepID=A0A919E851_9PROT|nr:alanine/glycine:cation symporter family protein [Kordiimonas sediminis]GHF23551.1 alanine glycine permease [Kordiimonas sediminis]